jgi:FAD/FMN-containing dehydrogenase
MMSPDATEERRFRQDALMSRSALAVASTGHYLRWLTGRSALPADAPSRSLEAHQTTVAALQHQLQTSRPPFVTRKRTVGHQARSVPTPDGGSVLDLRPLHGVLALDADRGLITVEPQVTIRQLLRATLPTGWAPAVLPEFPEITVGGAIQGMAAESTSHRQGLFHESVEAMEVLLGDGTRLQVTAERHPDLWRAIPGSYGTLGLVVSATLRLVPTGRWVEIVHRRLPVEEFINGAFDHDADAVDGIAVDADDAVATTARWMPSRPRNVPHRRFRRADPYYADHVMATADRAAPEAMTLEDYAFRFDRGAFWIAPTKLGRGPLSRLFLADFATAANLYRVRRSRQRIQPQPSPRVVQDCILPHDRAADVLRWVRTLLSGPIWLLPITTGCANLFGLTPGRWINLGIYLRHPGPAEQASVFNRELEERVVAAGGRKTLHARIVDPAAYLGRTADLAAYRHLRRRYAADGVFPDLVDKLRGTH